MMGGVRPALSSHLGKTQMPRTKSQAWKLVLGNWFLVIGGMLQASCRRSFRGYDPSLDFQSFTRDMQGRRINRLEPDASLILLKASGQMPHGGGRRFDPHSLYYDLLRRWVAQGADDDSTRASHLTKLEIIPNRKILIEPNTDLQLRILAYYADGSARDVTKLARFTLNDEAV